MHAGFIWYGHCVVLNTMANSRKNSGLKDSGATGLDASGAGKTEQAATAAVIAAMNAERISIQRISPCVESGAGINNEKYPAKSSVGQCVTVEATVFMDGHGQIAARVLWREPGAKNFLSVPMRALGNDLWRAEFIPQKTGVHNFLVEAWFDQWGTAREELIKKKRANVPIGLELDEISELLRTCCDVQENVSKQTTTIDNSPEKSRERKYLQHVLQQVERASAAQKFDLLTADGLHRLIQVVEERQFLRRSDTLLVDVERIAAGFSSWYELFPRSQTRDAMQYGTFDDVVARLPAIHAMGFDVLYFPPIHPIGRTHRKGRNNQLAAAPNDPGSPYAIGAEEGGHDAVHPELGGIEAFRRLRAAALDYGIEIALDFAVQCSPDHPWLQQHPEWFSWRPDGSIRYAENPPKKYEDIVNVDFYAEGAQPSLWIALRNVVLTWIGEGVKIFRVDNPHTKPLPFWKWLIADVRAQYPDTIFLAEAFTRPALMYELAKIGFSQSYTYFTWRDTKQDLTDYMIELTRGAPRDFFRPHFFVNTPDINPYFLQNSGRGGFKIRAALAATLSGLWGIYSGFELCEAEPVPGKEEYLDSEKYEIKPRDWNAPGNIIDFISSLNRIRRENTALHTHLHLRFYDSGNDQVLYFAKLSPDRRNLILVAISLDPTQAQEAYLETPFNLLADAAIHSTEIKSPVEELPADGLHLQELLRNQQLVWRGARQHWYFEPGELPLAIWRITVPPETGAQEKVL